MYTYEIIQDTEPESPREWDNLGTMFCKHRRYNLGDKDAKAPNWKDAIMLPLYLYDHNGITMRTTPFSCPWDSGQVGVIYVSREKVRAEYGAKRISQKLEARILEYLKNEVAVYDQYLTGDVWGYVIKKDGEVIESCHGIFGREYCEAEAKSIIERLKNI